MMNTEKFWINKYSQVSDSVGVPQVFTRLKTAAEESVFVLSEEEMNLLLLKFVFMKSAA